MFWQKNGLMMHTSFLRRGPPPARSVLSHRDSFKRIVILEVQKRERLSLPALRSGYRSFLHCGQYP